MLDLPVRIHRGWSINVLFAWLNNLATVYVVDNDCSHRDKKRSDWHREKKWRESESAKLFLSCRPVQKIRRLCFLFVQGGDKEAGKCLSGNVCLRKCWKVGAPAQWDATPLPVFGGGGDFWKRSFVSCWSWKATREYQIPICMCLAAFVGMNSWATAFSWHTCAWPRRNHPWKWSDHWWRYLFWTPVLQLSFVPVRSSETSESVFVFIPFIVCPVTRLIMPIRSCFLCKLTCCLWR